MMRLKDEEIKFLDLQFTGLTGRFHHTTMASNMFKKEVLSRAIPENSRARPTPKFPADRRLSPLINGQESINASKKKQIRIPSMWLRVAQECPPTIGHPNMATKNQRSSLFVVGRRIVAPFSDQWNTFARIARSKHRPFFRSFVLAEENDIR